MLDSFNQDPLEMIKIIQKEISANTCNKPKDVGDKVIVWDGSDSESVKDPTKHYWGVDLCDHECIIIAVNQPYIGTNKYLKTTHNLDCIVWSPKLKDEIRTCLRFTKLV